MAYIETESHKIIVEGKVRLEYTLGALDPSTNKVPVTFVGTFYYRNQNYTTSNEGTYGAKQMRVYINGTQITSLRWTPNYKLSPISLSSWRGYQRTLGTYYIDNPNEDGSSFTFTLKVEGDIACTGVTDYTFVSSDYVTKSKSGTVSVPSVARYQRTGIKINDVWKFGAAYIKKGGTWIRNRKVYIKKSGSWKESNY